MSAMKSKRNKVLILAGLGLVGYLIIFAIPMLASRELTAGSTIQNEHTWSSANYRLAVEEGEQYDFTVSTDPFWGFDMSIKLYSNALKVGGVRVDEPSASSEQIIFTATHSGYYYVSIAGGGGSGFYDVSFAESSGQPTETERHVNILKIGILLLPVILLALIYVLGQKLRNFQNSRPPRKLFSPSPMSTAAYGSSGSQAYRPPNKTCEYCGIEFPGDKEKCPNCGAYPKQ